MTVKPSTACHWVQEEEGDTWATQCGHLFTIIADTPSDNEMRFCCYCGRPVAEHGFELETEDDDE